MGIEIIEASPQRLVGTMPVIGNRQPMGLLHGGANVVLAESLGSVGTQLHAGADRRIVGRRYQCHPSQVCDRRNCDRSCNSSLAGQNHVLLRSSYFK
jgi:hypothetical protein